jgi:hypothetical protein
MRVRVLKLLLAAALLLADRPVRADAFVLVRHAKNPVHTLSKPEIKDMATGKRKVWPHGVVVQMVLPPPGSAELAWLASAVIGVPESTFMARVRQEVFKGEMRKPIAAPTEKECLAAIAADPGGLGVVSAATARSLPADVAVVAIR